MDSRALLFLTALVLAACDPPKEDSGLDSTPPADEDLDEDGYTTEDDCDDNDPAVFPGAEESCNEIDDDCDGEVDESGGQTWYADADGDGWGLASVTAVSCAQPTGYVGNDGDCDDEDDGLNPDASEVCDELDNDCDGLIDDEDDSLDISTGETFYRDADVDGYGDADDTTQACIAPDGYLEDSSDCDDSDEAINPDASEICDGVDNDCDGLIDDDDDSVDLSTSTTWFMDDDGDGYGDARTTTWACGQPSGWVDSSMASDCDDEDAAVNPDATEVCDGVDNDCDGDDDDEDTSLDTSTGETFQADSDGDGYGDAGVTTQACEQPSGYTTDTSDCDDTDASINPDADEVCDGDDNDCDGDIDDADSDVDTSTGSSWYLDSDSDGYGDARTSTRACDQPSGWVDSSMASDCDDIDASINPVATEVCDEVDNDCDGDVDDDDADLDTSSAGSWYADADGDGFGDASSTTAACDQPSGYVEGTTDCDDSDASVNPDATEVCDGVDTDCDGDVDDADGDLDTSTRTTWFEDADGDGYGNASMSRDLCAQPSGYLEDDTDCNDADATVNPTATEVCDGADNDCDGTTDNDDEVLGDDGCAATDCTDLLTARPTAGDGPWWVDPAGTGAYEVLCDMSTDGGGWALTAVGSDDGQTTWYWDARHQWDTDTTTFGDLDFPNEDYKSAVMHEILFEDLLFVHQPSGIWAAYNGVGDGSEAFADFIGALGESVCYDGSDGWDMSAGTLTVTGDLCSTQVFFNAMDNDGASCSSHDDSHGPAWSAANNAGCPLDDVGHYGFGNNSLYPTYESDASGGTNFGAGFGGPLGENTGTTAAAENYIQLWVR